MEFVNTALRMGGKYQFEWCVSLIDDTKCAWRSPLLLSEIIYRCNSKGKGIARRKR
jgi:hypothetical protein